MSNSNGVNIRVIEEQSEELHPCELSQDEIDAFLFKYNKEAFDTKIQQERMRQPQPHQRRMNGDIDTQKSNREYYDVRYREMDAGSDTLNVKIEIKSDMKF